MDYRVNDEALAEALRLSGWMFAQQALAAARGEIPTPLIAYAHDSLEPPQLLIPKVDSEFYDVQVAAGRILASDIGSQARHVVFAYVRDLEDSGLALVVEVDVGRPLHRITLGQRYLYDDKAGLRLIGDLHLIGQELLPSAIQESLEPLRWRTLLDEGITNHDLAGQQWPNWSVARDHTQTQLRLGRFSLTVPGDWLFRRTQDGQGWVMARLLPWEYREFEPTIIAVLVSYSDQATLENALGSKKSQLIDEGIEIFKAEIVRLTSSALSSKVAFLAWKGEGEGRSYRTEWVWVPTDEPGHFLLLCAASFYEESWEDILRTVKELLATLEGAVESSRVDGHAISWRGKLLQKLRRH